MQVLHPADGAALPISLPVRFEGMADDGVTTVQLFANGNPNDILLGEVDAASGRWTFVRNFSQRGVRTITAIGLDGNGDEVARTTTHIDLRLSNEFGYTPPEATLPLLGDIAGLVEVATPINKTFAALDHVAALLKLPGGQLYFDSNLDLDTDGKRSPGIVYESTHQDQTSLRKPNGQSLESNVVPFFVLPGLHSGVGPTKVSIGGIVMALGDIAAVLFGDKIEFAVFGDFGPTNKIGEGSMALHRALGHETVRPNGHIRDTDIERHVVTIVFPGSGDGMPHDPDFIRQKGRELFTALGGVLP